MNIIIVDKNKIDKKTLNTIEHFFDLKPGDLMFRRSYELTRSNKNILKNCDLIICDYVVYSKNSYLREILYEFNTDYSVQILLMFDKNISDPLIEQQYFQLNYSVGKAALIETLYEISIRKFKSFNLITVDNRIFFPSQILYVKRSQNRTWIYELGKKPFCTRTTFGKIYDTLKPNNFYKIERSTCINLNQIKVINPKLLEFKNDMVLELQKKLSSEHFNRLNQNLALLNSDKFDQTFNSILSSSKSS